MTRKFRRAVADLPTICFMLATVAGLITLYFYNAQRLERQRNLELKVDNRVLEKHESALEAKFQSLQEEAVRRAELIEQKDHELALQALRIANCEEINQGLYRRDGEQRLQIREFRQMWRACVDKRERLAAREP